MTDEKHPADDPRLTQVRSLQAVQKVIAGVAHDLNNPLAAILGYAHLLGGELEPAKVRQYAAFINSQALAARDLIDDLQECATSPTLRCVRTSVSDLARSTSHGLGQQERGVAGEIAELAPRWQAQDRLLWHGHVSFQEIETGLLEIPEGIR